MTSLKKATVAATLAAVLVAGTGAASAAAATYTVKKGDTLGEIAAANGSTVAQLAEANGINNVDLIFPSQVLELSKARTTAPTAEPKAAKATQGQHLKMVVSAYTAGVESTGKSASHPQYGVTASGSYVVEGTTIAAPREIPFGTKIYIPYFGRTFTVQDRGGAITGNRLDVYVTDLSRALDFGMRELDVYIIN